VRARLRGPYAEGLEPASESRASFAGPGGRRGEARRGPALAALETGRPVSVSGTRQASIRVVPPGFRSLWGWEARRFQLETAHAELETA